MKIPRTGKSIVRRSNRPSRPASPSQKRKASSEGASRSSRDSNLFSSLEPLLQKPLLSRREEQVSTPQVLFERNTRAAVRLGASFAGSSGRLEEFVSAALRGLWAAAQRFRPGQGSSFLTYATWWMRREIGDEIRVSHTITLPHNAIVGRKALERGDGQGFSAKKKARLEHAAVAVPMAADDGRDLDFPSSGPAPDDLLGLAEIRERLVSAVDRLDPKARRVVYGRLFTGCPETLEDIANELGLTRERIRQIEFKALRNLRKIFKGSDFSLDDLRLLSKNEPV